MLKKYKQTLLFIVLVVVVQTIVSVLFLFGLFYYYRHQGNSIPFSELVDHTPAIPQLLGGDLSNIAIILIAWACCMIRLPQSIRITRPQWSVAALPILLGVSWFLCETLLEELFPVPTDPFVEQTLTEASHTPYGFLSICLLGPICEELLMREGVLGTLLRNRVNPWWAIVLSSLAFGALHLNWSQFVFASIGGIVLGIIYWKTGNIVLPSIVHIANNTFSSTMVLLTDGTDHEVENYYDIIGKSGDVALIVVFGLLSIYLLARYLRRPEPQPVVWCEEVAPSPEPETTDAVSCPEACDSTEEEVGE